MRFKAFLLLMGWVAAFSSVSMAAEREQKVSEDFHLTTYIGQQDVVSDIELFTKQAEKEVFFGVTCSSMSPFPLLQILLFNDEVLSETPKFLSVGYRIDGESIEHNPALQGILKVMDSAEEFSNKVRLELEPGKIRSMNVMNEGYEALLNDLKAGEQVKFTLNSRAFGTKDYAFSLKGFKALIEPYESVCK